MVQRGWGRQMRLEWLTRHTKTSYPGDGAAPVTESYSPGAQKVARYLTKYLCKSQAAVATETKKKVFCSDRASKAGDTGFKWAPWIHPGSYLFAAGVAIFFQLYGHHPHFRDIKHVIRLGVEETNWAEVDFLWEFCFPPG